MLNTLNYYRNQQTEAVKQSYLEDLRNRERARMQEYIKAREYYDGVHYTQLTDRMRQFLNVGADADFTVNYCPMVVNAKADRLKVSGFSVEDEKENPNNPTASNTPITDTIWKWWRKNRMDRTMGIVHRAAVRDGDAFVLVEWDDDANLPRFYFEPAYAGEGVMVYYSEERREEIEFASKAWLIKYGEGIGTTKRMNLYFPDRIEKYISKSEVVLGRWLPYEDEDTDTVAAGRIGMAGISWWTDSRTQDGEPLGIPIVHFKHNDTGDSFGTSHLAKVMPVQDALNKTMIDLLGVMDSEAFGLLVGTGTNDWVNIKMRPGAIAAVSQTSDKADLKRLAGTNPEGVLSAYNALVTEIARISGTPMSYFQSSGQVAAEGTMKQQEIALITQVEKAQTDFGNGWEDCMNVARRLHNVFSPDPDIDVEPLIETVWESAETRNDKELAEYLVMLVSQLGVSKDQAQIILGFDATERAANRRDEMRRQALSLRQMQQQPPDGNNADDSQNLTQTENQNDTAGTNAA